MILKHFAGWRINQPAKTTFQKFQYGRDLISFFLFEDDFFLGNFFYESEIEVEKDIHCRLGTYRFFKTGGNAKYKQSTIKHNNCYNE